MSCKGDLRLRNTVSKPTKCELVMTSTFERQSFSDCNKSYDHHYFSVSIFCDNRKIIMIQMIIYQHVRTPMSRTRLQSLIERAAKRGMEVDATVSIFAELMQVQIYRAVEVVDVPRYSVLDVAHETAGYNMDHDESTIGRLVKWNDMSHQKYIYRCPMLHAEEHIMWGHTIAMSSALCTTLSLLHCLV